MDDSPPKIDRQLTKGEAEEFLATCYLEGLEQDLIESKNLIEAQTHKIVLLQDYIKIMESVGEERERKMGQLESTLERLETELHKVRKP